MNGRQAKKIRRMIKFQKNEYVEEEHENGKTTVHGIGYRPMIKKIKKSRLYAQK